MWVVGKLLFQQLAGRQRNSTTAHILSHCSNEKYVDFISIPTMCVCPTSVLCTERIDELNGAAIGIMCHTTLINPRAREGVRFNCRRGHSLCRVTMCRSACVDVHFLLINHRHIFGRTLERVCIRPFEIWQHTCSKSRTNKHLADADCQHVGPFRTAVVIGLLCVRS